MCGSVRHGVPCEQGHHGGSVHHEADCECACDGRQVQHDYGDCGCGRHPTGGCCCSDGAGIRPIDPVTAPGPGM